MVDNWVEWRCFSLILLNFIFFNFIMAMIIIDGPIYMGYGTVECCFANCQIVILFFLIELWQWNITKMSLSRNELAVQLGYFQLVFLSGISSSPSTHFHLLDDIDNCRVRVERYKPRGSCTIWVGAKLRGFLEASHCVCHVRLRELMGRVRVRQDKVFLSSW